MNKDKITMNPNPIVQFLKKKPSEFTREDLVSFIKDHGIKMINLNYVGGDNRLKTLSFAIRDENHLRLILDWGERVDGSSLFPYIDSSNSDLYVIPRFKTAFVNPFTSIPTLNLLCSYYDSNMEELEIAPERIIRKAHKELKDKTGVELHALGELEYYVITRNAGNEIFPGIPQKAYHESRPFTKYAELNDEILYTLTCLGIPVKYAHAEVGNITLINETHFEQYEIELDLEPVEDMADHLVIAKWIARNIAARHGVELTFAPKLAVGHAGSGLHIHMTAIKDGKNLFLDNDGELSETARKIIGGLMKLAPSLTAFGNTIPTSYLRLVPHQEAPTAVCWGERNRSGLVRVPLGWRKVSESSLRINPVPSEFHPCGEKQTIELRSPDGSANIYLLLAGITVAAKNGLTSDDSLDIAERCRVTVNIFHEENRHIADKLETMPLSCYESAEKLKEHAAHYLEDDVFNERIINGLEKQLKFFRDQALNQQLKNDNQAAEQYIEKFMHWG